MKNTTIKHGILALFLLFLIPFVFSFASPEKTLGEAKIALSETAYASNICKTGPNEAAYALSSDAPENCRIWGISGNVTDGIIAHQLVGGPNSIENLSQASNLDGWGIASFQNYGDAIDIQRGMIRAYNCPNWTTNASALEQNKPKIALAHIRACTSGCCDPGGESINNPHPFTKSKNGKDWAFEHNGGVAQARSESLLGAEYLAANPRTCSSVCDGPQNQSCDSEYYFLVMLKYIEANNWNVVDGIAEGTSALINSGETGGMNFILSDGTSMWAYRRPQLSSHTLYYLYNGTSGWTSVASQYPSATQGAWVEVPSRGLLAIEQDQAPVLINTTNYVPRTVGLISPADATSTTSTDVDFSCNVSGIRSILNVSFYLWNSTSLWYGATQSNENGFPNGTVLNFSATSMPLGSYTWNCLATDSSGASSWAASDFSLNIIASAPTHDTPLLTSTYGTNYTSENLTCYNQSTLNANANTFDWRKNGASLAVLDMTFNKNVSTSTMGAVSDYSTYQNNATLTGSAPIPQWVSGKISGAYSLDGANDYISAPHSSSLNGDGTRTEMTLEAWVKPSVSNHNGHIITKRNSTTLGSYQFGLDGTYTGRLFCTFYFGPGTGGNYTEALASVAGNPYLNAGNWYHIVCTYKNGTGVKVYVNGTLATSNPSSGTGDGSVRVTNGVPLRLGARANPAVERYFNGTIDEVKIYDHALSVEEIQNHYALGYNMLLSSELTNGSSYTCAVTPTDGTTDGLTKVSNALVATDEPGEPPANYDDVYFNSSFQSGNLYDVQYVGGDAGGSRVYNAKINYSTLVSGEYHWWFFFRMENASGKNIRVNITNPTSTDFTNNRWPNVRPRFSYDFGQGNVDPSSGDWSSGNWNALFPNSILYNAGARWFSFNISATQNTVWVAPMVPYTVLRRDRFLSSISASQYANITSLGTTTFGFNLSAVEITDASYQYANKKRVYIVGQQHANEEAQGSWEIEGAISYLLNDSNPTAQLLLQNYIFKFVPILNVDGVYNGTGRFSPLYNATTQWDPNRQWDDARAGSPTYNVVDWAYADIGDFAPNASLDLHGSMNGESPTIPVGVNYFLLDKAADSITNAFAGNISAQIPYIFSNWNVVTNSQSMPVNAYLGFGVHPSFTFENTATNATLTFVPTYTDWVNWGTGLLLGIHGYFNATGNTAYGALPTITINSPQNATYSNATILIDITSNGVYTWYEYNGTNYTYTSPQYRIFPEGANTLNVWANNSLGNTSFASVSFYVSVPQNFVVSKNGGTFASVAGTGTVAWSNPSNAALRDASYATATLAKGRASYYLRATNFSFQIPQDATINGVVVTVVKKSSSSSRTIDNHVYLVKNNVIGGTDKANLTNWSTSDTTVLYGSPTDTWGLSLSPSDINNITSGIAFSALHVNSGPSGNYVASVNYINITVYYSAAGGEGGQQAQAQAPSIEIISPQNATYSNASIPIDITSDGESTWYEYNGANYTYSSPEYRTFPEGANILNVWSNNSNGNVSGASVSFSVNTQEVPLPTIAINSPLNTTYATRSILVNITSDGESTWYEYNGANYTYTSPLSRNFNWGANTLKVWSNNSVGGTSSASVSFFARRN